ncbi:MAG: hypothetical protein JW727_05615 [Candidatus Aenigmarchaeota archaeon]|nr:hypothetical protein [Candidatus Aenigmarchaeota archaeon]
MEEKNLALAALGVSLALVFVLSSSPGETQLHITGDFFTPTDVGIIDQVEVSMYEENPSDNVFEFFLNFTNETPSYNGTYDGPAGGFDSFDGQTQLFTLENRGSTYADVLISAEDFSNGIEVIDVDRDNGAFQVYIPGVGWKNIPDGSDSDLDLEKDLLELCLADNIPVGGKVTGIDFRISGHAGGGFISRLRITAYNSATSNPCTSPGAYVAPGN